MGAAHPAGGRREEGGENYNDDQEKDFLFPFSKQRAYTIIYIKSAGLYHYYCLHPMPYLLFTNSIAHSFKIIKRPRYHIPLKPFTYIKSNHTTPSLSAINITKPSTIIFHGAIIHHYTRHPFPITSSSAAQAKKFPKARKHNNHHELQRRRGG